MRGCFVSGCSREGLVALLDPALTGGNVSMDQVSRVVAVASTCVQPEVTHRPFMGEVVRALMLVRGEGDQVEQAR